MCSYNDQKSNFQKIISSVPQGSVTGPILFNFSITPYLPLQMLLQNLKKNTLQSESEVVINWFKNNKMIVNPEKFHAITLSNQNHDYSNETIKFDNKTIEIVSSFRLLGFQLDDKLNFNVHL